MRHAHATRQTGALLSALAACALIALSLTAGAADAVPTEVNVRIEGRTQTLFEGPILTEGHDVSSYKADGGNGAEDVAEHPCDGVNELDPGNTEPGPVPTAASVDAMNTIGETDAMAGQWYTGFNDYFVKQWGVEEENAESEGRSWGILVNNVFTDVGGCQYQLSTGDEVLWTYNAFEARPFLALFAAGARYVGGDRPLTAIAQLGKPFAVEVLAYEDDLEDIPPAHPERTDTVPFPGAKVAPVVTSKKGLEKLDLESPETVTTDAEGKASITFTTPGWHRLKAGGPIEAETGEEEVIRSNRLDVCVPAEGASSCGEPPAEDQLRVPPRYEVLIGHEPKNWAAPDIYGSPVTGQTLTATEGEWTGKAPISYTYRWRICEKTGGGCEDIPGATSPSYEIPASAAEHTLRVIVKAKNNVASTEQESAATAVVHSPPSNTELPAVSGTAEEGQPLSVSNGKWIGSEPISYEYAWLRCSATGGECSRIAGPAATPTYTPTAADVGKTLRAQVTARNVVGEYTVETAATGIVKAKPVVVGAGPSGSTPSGGQTSDGGGTPGGGVLGEITSHVVAKASIASLGAKQLKLKVTAAATITIKIARRTRRAGGLTWQTVKTLEITAGRAGTVTVNLPHLSTGTYQVSIVLPGAKPLLRTLAIHRR